ncbi:methyltransferase domain-containing protein [Nocardia salmonicida]|uniref:methyltransferase domain-containing protein n=1 Tax=Nocardia salmonicida TaxID=53431 RepID=UPI0034223689
MRHIAEHLLDSARRDLGLSVDAVRKTVAAPEGETYRALASLSDTVMGRRPLADGVVDAFYTRARRGERGEQAFVGGAEAMIMHGYPSTVIEGLPVDAVDRFLGLGNIWRGIDASAGGRVVDIGCGAGVDLGAATMLCSDTTLLVGIDKRPDLLHVAATACPRAELVVGEIGALPLANGGFDLVLANGLPPLQRPATLRATAGALRTLTVRGGVVSATVIVAAPWLVDVSAEIFVGDEVLARGMAVLMSGKPTIADVVDTFEAHGGRVSCHQGMNPYRDRDAARPSAMYTVCAVAA